MLNPSTADASKDDPTIRKCMGFARRLGYGGIEVVNLFAYRARWPSELRTASEPVGPENDEHIAWACRGGKIYAGWGTNSIVANRAVIVKALIYRSGALLSCFAISKDGQPCHPLYLPYDSHEVTIR